jgi:antitoxin component YwqK of YwqJK toxin-antitoxin module
MKYYITINENNEITGGYIDNINKDIPKDAIEVSEAIWKQRLNDSSLNCFENGKLVKKDFTTNEQRVQQIEAKCNQVIEAVYSIYKQINITNLLIPYTEEDRDIMKAFIDSKRAICHKAISDGTNAENINWEVING